jgi:hypothetical protein
MALHNGLGWAMYVLQVDGGLWQKEGWFQSNIV